MTSGVAVIGLGKIGLPLAVQMAGRGLRVRGADLSPRVADLVSGGQVPFPGEPGLAERLAEVVRAGLLTAGTDTAMAVAESAVVVVVVPLVTDQEGRPDYRSVDAATARVAAGLRAGSLVSYETTLPVHTTRRRLAPALAAGSGLRPGHDFQLCYSPERASSGSVFADLRRYPKLVGGIDVASGERAETFYSSVLDFDERPDLARGNGVWNLGSAETAELTKLAETTYRDVNIALANEFAQFAATAGIDIYQVIAAANSQPFTHLHQPGISVGGHCIPVYPRLYLAGDPRARLPAAARQVNEAIPAQAVQSLAELAGGLCGQRVAVLGAAYRHGVKETAFSGVFAIAAELAGRGAIPVVHDPLYSPSELIAIGLEPYSWGERCDAVIIHTDHREYATLTPQDLPGVRAMVDGRAITDPARWADIPSRVLGIGVGSAPPRPRVPQDEASPGRSSRSGVNPPYRQVDIQPGQRRPPGDDVLVHAVDLAPQLNAGHVT